MSDIVQLADFETGLYEINYNTYQENNLQWYIDKYEKHYLLLLLGADEYASFIADLSGGVPVTAKFEDIFNSFQEKINDELVISDGMKEMVQGFIYFHYVRDTNTRQTTVGVKRKKGENSTDISLTTAYIQKRFNDSVGTYHAIYKYMQENRVDYEDAYTQELEYSLFV